MVALEYVSLQTMERAVDTISLVLRPKNMKQKGLFARTTPVIENAPGACKHMLSGTRLETWALQY